MALTPSQARFMLQAQAIAPRDKSRGLKKNNSARSNSLNMPLQLPSQNPSNSHRQMMQQYTQSSGTLSKQKISNLNTSATTQSRHDSVEQQKMRKK